MMKKYSLILDMNLIKKVQKISGQKTITGTIHFALKYVIKQKEKDQQINHEKLPIFIKKHYNIVKTN